MTPSSEERDAASRRGASHDSPRALSATPDKRQRLALDARGLAAFAVYLALAALFFARGAAGRFSSAYIGRDVDPQLLMWLMAWWPHAIRHGLNPLYTRAVWAPQGANLAWSTCMPLVSMTFAPVVLAMGPVFAHNLACLLAVSLAGWCAFILCRYVTGAYWPSVVGGYVFAFSAYMLGELAGHFVEALVFPVPLFAWLLIRALRADITRRAFVTGQVLVLVAEFLLLAEGFATMTLFAAIALVGVMVAGSRADKRRATEILPAVGLSYAIALTLLSPYLYCMMALGYEPGAAHPPLLYSTDLLNLIIPTPAMELGRLPLFSAISGRFLGYIYEAGGYVGIPLIVVVIAFVRSYWQEPWARVLVYFFLTAVILSLGPFLLIGGRLTLVLPGAILVLLPLIGKALPARLMLYAFLAIALMTAAWLSTSRLSDPLRALAAVVIALSILPNLSARFWTTLIDLPPFFGQRLYAKFLARNENAVVLPYGYNGDSMLWQLESNWYFRMAGGNVGPAPAQFRRWPAVRTFYRVDDVALPAAADQLRAFLGAHNADVALVDDREEEVWRPLLATLGVPPVRAGGITLYRIAPADLAPWENATSLGMETRADRARFAALVLAAESRLRSGASLAALTPADALKADALPAGWVMISPKRQPPYEEGGLNLPRRPPNPHLFAGMWLKAESDGRIEVGVAGGYPALRAVLDEYRTASVDFTPRDLADAPASGDDDRRAMLVMTFTAAGLARAAAIARGAANQTPARVVR